MSHGHTRTPTRGVCIYCGKNGARLTDEHIVPFSLGGQHVLEGASCDDCANVTKKFEQDVARELWGPARNSYNAPSRRKKQRDSHILLSDPKQPGRKVKVPYDEYPAAMVFYKMGKAGLLEGLPSSLDTSSAWLLVALHDDAKAKVFQQKFDIGLTSKFRNVPQSFARVLAKIGYCHVLTVLEPGDFRPICLPYILGTQSNLSYVVGGAFELAPPDSVGYSLKTAGFGTNERLMLIAEVRLFANNSTPTYHIVVGDVSGERQVTSVLKRIGPVLQIGRASGLCGSTKDDHWSPRIWPLPFWRTP